MPNVSANGIQIEYECFGDASNPPLLLIMGLGAQMIVWDDEFCEQLADRGFRVIRFDNRDVGLSTHFRDAPAPDLEAVLQGDTSSASYTLSDMAADAAATARRSRHPVGSHRRRFDGRDDRPGVRDRAS